MTILPMPGTSPACAAQRGSHQPPVETELLTCGQWDREADFEILTLNMKSTKQTFTSADGD